MKAPRTELDSRFSEPDATATDWNETGRVLEAAELFWLCTVRADGRPHLTPLVAVWFEEALYFTTGDAEQKYLNMLANPHVLLVTGCNDWDHGLDVSVEGKAVPVTDEHLLSRLAPAWAKKWDGRWQWRVQDGAFQDERGVPAYVFSLKPKKILAFAKGSFSHTRHVF
jgi:nitroimidazol reductase NimA-like FMN-containing flavoprotein (pyridoxamine 5'-phosphate oxidase superfamily)